MLLFSQKQIEKTLIIIALVVGVMMVGCSSNEDNLMTIFPTLKDPLAIRISNKVWLFDLTDDSFVGNPILLDQFKIMQRSMSGNAIALPNGKIYITSTSDGSETMVGKNVFVLDWNSLDISKQYQFRAPNNIMLSSNNLLYVTGASNTVLVIDPNKEKEVNRISCERMGDDISIFESANKIYVTYDEGICIIDAITNIVIDQLQLSEDTIYGSIVIDNSKIYIVHFDSISIYDLANWQLIDYKKIEGGLLQAIVTPESGKIYLTQCDQVNNKSNLLAMSTIDNSILRTIGIGNKCDTTVFINHNKAYIVNKSEKMLFIINIAEDEIITKVNFPEN